MARKPYPSAVSGDEWAFVAPSLTLMTEEAPPRTHSLREVFNGLRWVARAGAPWRRLPNDLPPWEAVYPQPQRWLKAGLFKTIVHDVRMLLRRADGRPAPPSATSLESRTLQSSPARGHRAGDDGAPRQRGSQVHLAVATLGPLLALQVTPAHAQDRAQGAQVAAQLQAVTGAAVDVAFVEQGHTGDPPAQDAAAHGLHLAVVKLPEAKKGFVLWPRRWVVERSFAWAPRFRRLARDSERLPETLAGFHFLVLAILMLARVVALMGQSA
jgi:transposase